MEEDEDWIRGKEEAANLSSTINEILANYDPKLRPNAGGKLLKKSYMHLTAIKSATAQIANVSIYIHNTRIP